MPPIQVSLPALDELSARVAIAGGDVQSALGRMEFNACIDSGNPALSEAIDGFTQFWQSAVKGGAQAIDNTAGLMAAAAAQYGHVDSTVMVDPSLTASFTSMTLDGDSGEAQLLLGPLLPGAGG